MWSMPHSLSSASGRRSSRTQWRASARSWPAECGCDSWDRSPRTTSFLRSSRVGVVTGLLGLPLLPFRGVVWLAEQVLEQAEEQFYDPTRIRAQLEQVDEARRSGE